MVYNLMTLYQRSALKRFNINWKGNFFAPGEGKSELDRHFGQIHFAIDKYLQTLLHRIEKLNLKLLQQ